MRVLLTGATGFIGQHTLNSLIETGYHILCTKRTSSNLEKLGEDANKCKFVNTDSENWIVEIEKFAPQVIINLAWSGVDAANRGNWSKQIENLLFQQQLLDIAAKVGTEKFIGIGSQAEYGTFNGCISENYPIAPNTAYGAVKVASMEILKSFCELNSIDWYWFRLFSCFGDGEADNWLIPATIKNMMNGGSMDFTPGEQRYAYLYIGEVAQTIAKTVSTTAHSGVYNISSQNTLSIKDLLTKIQQRVNPKFKLNFGAMPYREGQAMWMQGDTVKLRSSIYTPQEDFEQKLEQTIQHYIKRNE